MAVHFKSVEVDVEDVADFEAVASKVLSSRLGYRFWHVAVAVFAVQLMVVDGMSLARLGNHFSARREADVDASMQRGSWDSFIDNILAQSSGNCDAAAIIGLDGSKWTSDGHASALRLTASEAQTLGAIMQSQDFTPLQAGGIYVAGVKYQFLRGEDKMVLGKKKDLGAITLVASNSAVVIAHTAEGRSQGSCNIGAGVIAEYLSSLGMSLAEAEPRNHLSVRREADVDASMQRGSWDSFIDNILAQSSGNCDAAAIIGLDGSKWTSDGHASALRLTASEAQTLGAIMQSQDFTPLQAGGIYVAGVKYQFLRGEDKMVLGKKKDLGAITLVASNSAVVIAHTAEGRSQGSCNIGAGVIAEYLSSLGMSLAEAEPRNHLSVRREADVDASMQRGSWDSYIDNILGQSSGHCDTAAIIGLDGSKWTTDAHASALRLTASEAQTLGATMNGQDFSTWQASGIYVAGVKYQFLRAEDKMVLGKKKDFGAITLVASSTAVVIAHTAEGAQQGMCNKGVEVIAEYLSSLGM